MLLSAVEGALRVTVTSDEWEALDAVASPDLELVVCNPSLRTLGGTPFYRFLWTAKPDIKRRMVFVAHSDTAPASTAEGRAAPVVYRPLTRQTLSDLVESRRVSRHAT
jgi:hypothetical protein